MDRSNPYRMMEEFFERMSTQFEDLSRRGGPIATTGGDELSLDVADRGEAFEVTIDVPGFDRDEIDVRLAEDTLTITATHEHEAETDEGAFIHRERAHRTLTRSVDLPASVDETAIEATLTNGVLTVTLPKEKPAPESHGVDVKIE